MSKTDKQTDKKKKKTKTKKTFLWLTAKFDGIYNIIEGCVTPFQPLSSHQALSLFQAPRMSSLWKQKAEQRDDARDTRIIAEGIARRAAKVAAEAAKTPEQKAKDARNQRELETFPAAAAEERWKRLYAEWDEARRIREGGHPKVDLSRDFPSLGGAAASAGKK